MEEGIFRWLVERHIMYNLPRAVSHLHEGRITHPSTEDPLQEGSDEGQMYHGLLIVSIPGLAGILQDHDLIDRESGQSTPLFDVVSTQEELFALLDTQYGQDGVYLMDEHGRIALFPEVNNRVSSLSGIKRKTLDQLLPADFVAESGNPTLESIGTKTRLALRLVQAFAGSHAYQIKESAYGSLGMGKITHITTEGLQEEVVLQHVPRGNVEYVNPEHPIAALHKTYDRDAEGRLRATGKYIDPITWGIHVSRPEVQRTGVVRSTMRGAASLVANLAVALASYQTRTF